MRGFLLAITGLAMAVTPLPVLAQRAIQCSSSDGKRHYCDAETRGGVSMKRQLSDANCEEGFSWGYDRRGIWVDHGCRAEFVVDSGYGAEPPEPHESRLTLTCSSDDGKRHNCSADTRYGVRMFHQLSKARCEEGFSWGFDRNGIWVDHGCRADFRLHAGTR